MQGREGEEGEWEVRWTGTPAPLRLRAGAPAGPPHRLAHGEAQAWLCLRGCGSSDAREPEGGRAVPLRFRESASAVAIGQRRLGQPAGISRGSGPGNASRSPGAR